MKLTAHHISNMFCAPAGAFVSKRRIGAKALNASALACSALLAGAAWAQHSPPSVVDVQLRANEERLERLAQAEVLRDLADQARMFNVADELVFAGGAELGMQRTVKGAPYCADALHETVQPLTDGNRIVRSQSTRLCRDGDGRTRQEVTGRDGSKRIYLRDPVANETWLLDEARKTAQRITVRTSASLSTHASSSEGPAGGSPAAWQQYSDQMREWARDMAERARAMVAERRWTVEPLSRATPPGASASAPGALPQGAGPVTLLRSHDGHSVAEVKILRIGGASPNSNAAGSAAPHSPPAVALPALPAVPAVPAVPLAAPVAAMPPMPAAPSAAPLPPQIVVNRAWSAAPRGPGSVQALPAREIEGVRVNGERSTWTIEAGRIGNEKPILITREVWTSPELMLTVLTRDNDPRSGEVSYRLQNIKRGEPDAALMRVPAEFQRKPTRGGSAPAGQGPSAEGASKG